ncbi:MAG: FG-GAP-like repeat-containing protein, partial [Polyangiaceae bacterium]|nr:FG-GAP-like repeat-containing protein [Polyangiaceae bacterium]
SQAGIQRSLRLGVPAYDGTDVLEVVGLKSTGQLVQLPNGGYRLEGQGNSYVGRAVDGGFELVDADGLVYRFGTTADARKESGSRVSFWYLQEVRDVAGHTIHYGYRQDRGEVYLAEISWGPLVGEVRALRAELVYEARRDAVVSFRTGFRVESAQRLAEIRVWSFGAVQRTITLGYEDQFPLTRLQTVRVTGRGGQETLPELSFSYAGAQPGEVEAVPNLDGWALNSSGTSFFDVDRDGAMDLLRLTWNGHSYRRNLGGRFDAPVPLPGAAGASLENVRLLDLTGDSVAELVWQQGSQWKVFQLSRDGSSTSWLPLGTWSGAQNVNLTAATVTDVNGDFRMDLLSPAGSSLIVRLGTANGLSPAVLKPAIDRARTYIAPGSAETLFPDINGDGLADAVYMSSTSLYMYLGKGDGTFEKLRDLPYPWNTSVQVSQIRMGDLNRDGLGDLVLVQGGNVAWYRGLANGLVETTPVLLPRPPGSDATVVVTLADANGNGSEDVVWSSPTGMWALDLAGPTSAGMLVGIQNGLGQTQALQYDASAQLSFAAADAGAAWKEKMPISIPVAVSSRLELGSGEPPRTTRLGVRDGIYDWTERRFVGFLESVVTRTDASGADVVRQVRQFHPGLGKDRALRGQVLAERIENGSGAIYRETRNDLFAATVSGLPSDQPLLRRAVVRATDVVHYEGSPAALQTRTEYEHDEEGRVVGERDLGRVDRTGDESIRRLRYTVGRSAKGVRDKVCEQWQLGSRDGQSAGPGAVVMHAQVVFGDHEREAPLCDAGAGWPRIERQYLESEARWVDMKTTAYDAHGNPVSTREGGVTRRIAYDDYALHPLVEMVQPSAERTLGWEATWDYVLGQPTSVRDATGVVVNATYDGLGRVTALGREAADAHIRYRYQWEGPRPQVESFLFDGDADAVTPMPAAWTPNSGWRHTVKVFNSAGEELFAATRLAEDRWLVAGARSRDALGRTVAVADPFEWTGTLEALPQATVPAGVATQTIAYDSLDRVVDQSLATGAHKKYRYRAFETTVTMDGMAPVTSTFDGAGRISRTERTVGGVVEHVTASYDAAGRITSMAVAGGTQSAQPVVHRFQYDTLGRLVFATDPDIGDRRLAYDDSSRLVEHTNGAGQRVSYDYDDAGRLTEKHAEDGSRFVLHYDDALDSATFRHTAGRLAWVEEPEGKVELGYDAFGQVNVLRRTVQGKTAEEKTTYAPSGLPLHVDYGDGVSFDIEHDSAGRA